jgi:hypothetical protein
MQKIKNAYLKNLTGQNGHKGHNILVKNMYAKNKNASPGTLRI